MIVNFGKLFLICNIDPSLNITTFVEHKDAVWDFKLSPLNLLASASADKSVKIWDTEAAESPLKLSLVFDHEKLGI